MSNKDGFSLVRNILVLGAVLACVLWAVGQYSGDESRVVAGPEDLRIELQWAQLLTSAGRQSSVVYDAGSFVFIPNGDPDAEAFADGLVPVTGDDGETAWPVALFEDALTSETVFVNAVGGEIDRLSPVDGHTPSKIVMTALLLPPGAAAVATGRTHAGVPVNGKGPVWVVPPAGGQAGGGAEGQRGLDLSIGRDMDADKDGALLPESFLSSTLRVPAGVNLTLYPWAGTASSYDDSIANTGQAMALFSFDPQSNDFDGDGLTNGAETVVFGTNPFVSDTDGDGLSDGAETTVPFLTLWDFEGDVGRVFTNCAVDQVTASDNMRAALLKGGRVVIFTGSGAGLKACTNDCGAVEIDATDAWVAARLEDGNVKVWREVSGGLSESSLGSTNAVDISGGFQHLLVLYANGKVTCLKAGTAGVPAVFTSTFISGATSVARISAGSKADALLLNNKSFRFGDALTGAYNTKTFAGTPTPVPVDVASGTNKNYVVLFSNGVATAYNQNKGTDTKTNGVVSIAAGGDAQVLAVLSNGSNVVFTTGGTSWNGTSVTNRLLGARSLWWRRSSRLAVSESGGLVAMQRAVKPGIRLNFMNAALTPGITVCGIASACSGTSPTNCDSDVDGLLDGWEVANGFNPCDPADAGRDTDGDGMPDWWEMMNGLGLANPSDAAMDADGDGLTNGDEYGKGTNPHISDTDGDGLNDGAEVTRGTNPLVSDTDSDGLNDGAEVARGTNPLNPDTDSDGLNDGAEVSHGTNPLVPDTDCDGLSDGFEITHNLDPLVAVCDVDCDGLTNADELLFGTNPLNTDTDSDGLSDSVEVNIWHTDPLDPDTDCDGLDDGAEVLCGTDPLNPDTEGDGLPDGAEVLLGADPLTPDTDGDGLSDGAETVMPFLTLWNSTGGVDRVFVDCQVQQVTASDAMRAALLAAGRVVVFTGSGTGLRAYTNDCEATELDVTESWVVARTSGGRLQVCRSVAGGVVFSDAGLSSVIEISGGYQHLLVRHANGSVTCLKGDAAGAPVINPNPLCTSAETNAVCLSAGVAGDAAILKNGKILLGNSLRTDNPFLVTPSGTPVNLSAGSNGYCVVEMSDRQAHAYVGYMRVVYNQKGSFLVPDYYTYTGPTGVLFVASGGSKDMVAVLSDGRNAVFTGGGTAWSYSAVTNRLTDVRSLWWKRDCRLAVTGVGGLLPLAAASASGHRLDYRSAAVTPRGLKQGIAAACSGTSPTHQDTDGDGLGDVFEVKYGLDPLVAVYDADGDGLSNTNELALGTCPYLNDTEGDGLSDGAEITRGTNPLVPDTDGDGLADGAEIARGTNPLISDTDGDGLADGDEVSRGTNTLIPDTDGDALADGAEVLVHHTDPLKPDTDGDGLSDNVEFQGETSPLLFDTDGDGLGDGDEYDNGTDPLDPDTDHDGMSDGWELKCGFEPLDPSDALTDADSDDLTNVEEAAHDTDPHNPDTDFDGLQDGWEAAKGLNPLSGLASSLVGWWQFREGTGTTSADLSGHGNAAVIVRPCTHVSWVSGYALPWGTPIGGALRFLKDSDAPGNSNGGYVGVSGLANAPMAGGFTVAAWICAFTPGSIATLLTKSSDVWSWNDGTSLYCTGGSYIYFYAGGNYSQSEVNASQTVYGGLWHHLCCVYNPTNASVVIYVDGQVSGSRLNVPAFASNSAPLWIGSTFKGYYYSQAWDGDIADVRFYTSALSSNAVQGLLEFQADPDGDGLSNLQEQQYGADPLKRDSDDDGLADNDEITRGTDLNNPDTDGDGISDGIEVQYSLDPLVALPDADGDGLTNIEESGLGTNPLLADTDGDGLSDGVEVILEMDPLSEDTEGDGLEDGDEVALGTDPLDPDSDGDGLTDGVEVNYLRVTDPLNPDTDSDGLSDGVEVNVYYTSPCKRDTDDDYLDDAFEIRHELSPTDYDSDPDNDGLMNFEELRYGTDPIGSDTDDDGLPDGEEIARFSNSWPYHKWFDVSGGTDLLAAMPSGDLNDGLITVPLPFSTSKGGRTRSEATVSVNGAMWLLTPGWDAPVGLFNNNVDLAEILVSPCHVFIAGYWDDLKAYPNELGSAITMASVVSHNRRYCVIEYRNMGFNGVPPSTNDMLSFQIVLPESDTNRVYVNYGTVSGAADGRSATVGTQAPGELQRLAYSFNRMHSVYSGYHVFVLGTGTDPLVFDTDGDGLSDGEEIALGTDPLEPDTDGDGFDDRWEVECSEYGFDPLVPSDRNGDYDGDGLTNIQEFQLGTNPGSRDSDDDGIEDAAEVVLGTDPTKTDTDGDGLSDWQEVNVTHTDPAKNDSDGDTLSDGWELANGFNPLVNNLADADPANDPTADPDSDGLDNFNEYLNNTDPYDPDTDGDGVSDGVEVAQGSDPTDASDGGNPPPAGSILELPFSIYGDYASWEMMVSGISANDSRVMKLSTSAPGGSENVTLKLRKGCSYRITMRWLKSKQPSPLWYCWEAQVGGLPTVATFNDYSNIRKTGVAETLTGNGWFADNTGGLLTSHVHMKSSGGGNVAGSLSATLYIPKVEMAVDGDRDGEIEFPSDPDGHKDSTSTLRPYRFWINTDEDVTQDGGMTWSDPDPERIPPQTPDRNDTIIQGTRDLEDFSRLHLHLAEDLVPLFKQGRLHLGLKWKRTVAGTPVIRLYKAVEEDGGLDYIKSPTTAADQLQVPFRNALKDRSSRTSVETTSDIADYVFRATDIVGPNAYYIFEGVRTGVGARLVPIIMDSYGNVIGEGNEVWFDLYNIEELYMRAHSTPAHAAFPLPYRQDANPPEFPYANSPTGGLVIPASNESFAAGFDVPTTPVFIPANPSFNPAHDEENKCIVFVHGIALSVDDVACYTGSFYKRLWWEGYRGRLAAYRWSTPLVGVTEDGFYMFSDGEYNSFHSSLGLKAYVESLKQQMPGVTISLAAHSLGNACAGNALRQGLTVDSYVMLEAATSLSCYFAPPVAPNNDVLQNSYVQELVNADVASPTPNFVADQGYRGFLANIHENIANNWVNYYNNRDFWLAMGETSFGLDIHWVRWNAGFKPYDPTGPNNYEYNTNFTEGTRCQLDLLGYNVHRPVEDICEALAFVARSRTRAVGAEPWDGNPRPPFANAPVDLREYEFDNPRYDHSGQFQRNICLMYSKESGVMYKVSLYRQLLRDLNME